MRNADIVKFAVAALSGHRLRSALMTLAMAIGVAAVVLLTALGEGARQFVMGEFASLGTNLVIVLPGRSETAGGAAGLVGETTRDLTIDDALALTRHHSVVRMAPIVIGTSPVSFAALSREVPVLGSTNDLLALRQWEMAVGEFLPSGDPARASPVCVLGAKVARELFVGESPLGQWVRIGDSRFRVIGIMATEGRSIGMDVEELVIVPVASAQSLMNTESLFRILVEASTPQSLPVVTEFVRRTITERHQGEEDITVVTQDAVLATFDRILKALTATVAGIAGISLAVAGILIMNIMLVAVSQRTAEIGLLKALGAAPENIIHIFLAEAGLLAFAGALAGLALGQLGSWFVHELYPALPAQAPWWALLAAPAVAVTTGLVFGIMPARRAARLDPVTALSKH